MKRIAMLAVCLAISGMACAPREGGPPHRERHTKTLTLPVWSLDVVEEIAADRAAYSGKTLVIRRAYLDPTRDLRLGKAVCRFPLRGGGTVVMRTERVPGWLRQWTGAPLKLEAALHPPRESAEGEAPDGPVLRGLTIDFANPIELACVEIERGEDGGWLIARVANYRGEKASATLEARFGTVHRRTFHRLAPGEAEEVRVKLFGPTPPAWPELPPEDRRLRLRCHDGSEVWVDLGKWLEEPPTSLLDWGYEFNPPGNACLALSRAEAELERFAALELRSYLGQFTNANIEPVEPEAIEALPVQPLLVVGTPRQNPLAAALVGAAGLGKRLRAVGDDGYLLKTVRHGGRPTLLVAASTPHGLVHAVYGLLEHYGVRFTLGGARVPARGAFHVLEIDEAKSPVFSRRRLVASGPDPTSTARWSHRQWLSMFDMAAKNRFDEVVVPLDGLEATFACSPGRSRGAVFPFEVGAYSCVAEAYLAHQQGLAILADYARRRGLELSFARRSPEGRLVTVVPPHCVEGRSTLRGVGQPIELLEDAGDFLGLPRVEETAKRLAKLVAAKAPMLSMPYRGGGGGRASYAAKFAWDPTLTPEAYFRGWAETLCEGDAMGKLAGAVLAVDRLDEDLLAAAPRPFGLGVPLVMPVEEDDLACDWAELRARASSASVASQMAELKSQSEKLRDIQNRIDPIHAQFREALGTIAPPWEEPLFEAAPATRRRERISEAIYRFRALLGALASVQEGMLAYYTGLGNPGEALPQLRVASAKYRKARRILLWMRRRTSRSDLEPTLASLAERLREQAERLAEWLGPVNEAEPTVRLRLPGSDAIVHLFRTRSNDIYAAYKLEGHETVHLRLNTREARLFRRGRPPRTIRAEGGLFLVSLDTVPVYIVRRTAWPGQPPGEGGP
jgi:hypothetical protein